MTIFSDITLEYIPRLISLLNRNPFSKTYGCFDREHWHYTTIDFACARRQEAVLTLALLYNKKNTPYYQNKSLLAWINAALNFWTKIQNKNGSFNEWYPNENSFVATAFSSYAVSETLLLLEDKIKNKKKIINSLEKSARFLYNVTEEKVLNQSSGAALALYNTYLLTKKEKYKRAAKQKINFLLKNQTKEGWFNEYGGPDIGYLSLTIDYFVKYYKKTKDQDVLDSIKKATGFLVYFLHPNLTIGGSYASRNTEYIIPHGITYLSTIDKNANIILQNYLLKNKTTVFPHSIDDRYMSYILYTWLQADQEKINKTTDKPLFNKEFNKEFPLAKIQIINNKNFYAIINKAKGGTAQIFFKKSKKHLNDCGINLILKDNTKLTSCFLGSENKNNLIRGNLVKMKDKHLTPTTILFLRGLSLITKINYKIGLYLRNELRKKLITGKNKSKIIFTREIKIEKEKIKIIDTLKNIHSPIKELKLNLKLSTESIPSSRYFNIEELNSIPLTYRNIKNKFQIIREYNNKGELTQS